jgi:hypothetical protein
MSRSCSLSFSPGLTPDAGPDFARISARALALWRATGFVGGAELDSWYAAAQESAAEEPAARRATPSRRRQPAGA